MSFHQLNNEGKRESSARSPTLALANTVFITVSVILGTGILALPVSLSTCGITPFLPSFTLCLFMQLSVVFLMVELLQRTHAELAKKGARVSALPDLHRMGDMYLPRRAVPFYNASVVLHFFAVLISYCLAGPEAYSELLRGVPFQYLIAPFWIVYTSLVLFGGRLVHFVISGLTFIKVIFLLLAISAVGAMASEMGHPSKNQWKYLLQPVLIGTIALGGVLNIMPVTYSQLPFIKEEGLTENQLTQVRQRNASLVWKYRASVCGGIFLCYILNILWALFIISTVPQEGAPFSLAKAAEEGQISTVPLIALIQESFKRYSWIAGVVSVFVLISVSVSYMALGTGLKHVIDGFAHAKKKRRDQHVLLEDERVVEEEVEEEESLKLNFLLYGASFGLILVIALANPNGFVLILEIFGTLSLNLECGVFVVMMVYGSIQRQQDDEDTEDIPLPLQWNALKACIYFAGTTFTLACVYDLITAGPKLGISIAMWTVILILAAASLGMYMCS